MGKKEEKPGSSDSSRQASVQPLVLTIKETAHVLKLSESKVYTMLEHRHPGGIPVKHFGRSLRISLSDLRRWLEAQ